MHTGDFPLIGGLHKCPGGESYKPGGGIFGRAVCISHRVLFETLFFLGPLTRPTVDLEQPSIWNNR